MRKTEKIYKKEILNSIILGLLATFSLTMEMSKPAVLISEPEHNAILEIISNLFYSFSGEGILPFLVFCVFFLIEMKFINSDYKKHHIGKLVNFIIALIWLMAEGFRRNDSLVILFSSPGQIFKSFIYFIGSFELLNVLMYIFCFLIDHFKGTLRDENEDLSSHIFLKHFTLLILFWVPHIIIAYPAFICYDSYYQLGQYFGVTDWTAHHPPFSTMIMGSIIEIGKTLRNGNLGFFLYVLLQAFIFSAILSYGFVLLNKMRMPKWLLYFSFGGAIIIPYYTAYIGVIVKDNFYSYAFVLFFIEILFLAIEREQYFKSIRHPLLWCISVLLLLLMRNNGKYVVLPFYLILIILAIRQKSVFIQDKKLLTKLVLVLFTPFLLNCSVSFYLNKKYDIKPGSIREAMSLPLQQTARYVKAHKEEVTSQEESILRSVLDYDNLAENYDPRISDPVKRTFIPNPSKEDLVNYLSVWGKQLLKHPVTYINATLNQNYYLVYPKKANILIYTYSPDTPTGYLGQDKVNHLLGVHDNEKLAPWKNGMILIYKTCFNIPFVNLFCHPAFYTIMFLWLLSLSIEKRITTWIFVSFPIILSILIIILAPAIQGQPRYAFPLIYSFSFALCYYIYIYNSKKAERFDTKTDELPQGDNEM